jgi:hypothetical protein
MTTTASPVRLRQHSPAYWRVTFDNPPINLHDAEVVAGLKDLVDRLDADPHVQVVVFDSANPDFYMAHIDLVRRYEVSQEPGPTGLPPWPDILTRLEHAPYITVGSVRGRARGVGSEFLLALDIRFASRERAIFCQPEIGFGFFPRRRRPGTPPAGHRPLPGNRDHHRRRGLRRRHRRTLRLDQPVGPRRRARRLHRPVRHPGLQLRPARDQDSQGNPQHPQPRSRRK